MISIQTDITKQDLISIIKKACLCGDVPMNQMAKAVRMENFINELSEEITLEVITKECKSSEIKDVLLGTLLMIIEEHLDAEAGKS